MATHQWLEEAHGERRYYWERGFFVLASRPPYCDRGRFQVFLEARAVDDRGWSRYFFSEDNAKEEIALWLANWQALQEQGYTRPYPDLEHGSACWVVKGQNCTVTLRPLTNQTAIGNFIGTVSVHPGRDVFFTVDHADLFPRCYFDRDVAIGELTAWMICRREVFVE